MDELPWYCFSQNQFVMEYVYFFTLCGSLELNLNFMRLFVPKPLSAIFAGAMIKEKKEKKEKK